MENGSTGNAPPTTDAGSTTDSADSGNGSSTTGGSPSSTPGFGLTVALVAVLGAALVALRD